MRPGPASAVAVLESYVGITDAPRSSRSVLLQIIKHQAWYVGDEAVDKADAWDKNFVSQVRLLLNLSVEEGWFQVFTLNSKNPTFIQGSCFAEPGDDHTIVEAKRRRANTLYLYQAVRKRSATELERICVRLLSLL